MCDLHFTTGSAMKLFFCLFFMFTLVACQNTPDPEPIDTIIINEEIEQVSVIEEEGLSNLVEVEINEPSLPIAVEGYDNLWLKLAEGFEFDVPENARIAKARDYYLSHPAYLSKVSKRAEPFLWLIVEQIQEKQLPLELALLPVVESTFDPFAYSHAGASG